MTTDLVTLPDTEYRSVPFDVGDVIESRATDGSPTLTFEGYAAVFGQTATVTDWRGTFDEQFERRAFDRTIQLRSQATDEVRQVKFLFNHGLHPLISNMPIGQIRNLKTDSRGLHVRARMPVNWLNQPIIDGIRLKQITGMSINFIAERETWSSDRRSRTVEEATLLELGPVIDPVYTGTDVSLRSLSAHLRQVAPDLFSSTGTLPPADTEGEALSTLDAYQRILSRR
jgi:HK97 family phage prohead protease